MSGVMRYSDAWLTDIEKMAINAIVKGAVNRLLDKRERNGSCPCRCRWPLEDDGSNRCTCCASVSLDYDYDEEVLGDGS